MHLIILAVPNAAATIANDTLRALAVTSAQRLPAYPDVGAVSEVFPGFDFAGWWVLTAPTGTPQDILERVNREMNTILKDPVVVNRMREIGFITHGAGTLAEARDYAAAIRGLGQARARDRPAAGVGELNGRNAAMTDCIRTWRSSAIGRDAIDGC